MASLEDWKTAGVDLRVFLSTSGDLVLPSVETAYPFAAGGPAGVPSGWSQYQDNPNGITNYAYSVSGGIFNAGCVTPGYNNISIGAYRKFTANANKIYQAQVKFALQPSHNDTRFGMMLSGYDPITQTYDWLTQIADWDATTEWQMAAITASRVLAARYTQIDVLFWAECKNLNEGTTYNWGLQFDAFKIVEFDASAAALTWRDITCDVQQLSWRYGRERFTNRFDVATIGMQVNNKAGQYSYAEPHSFGLEPGRIVKVEATYNGTMYPQAFGIVDQLTDGVTLDGKAVTNITCLDPTSIFSNRPTPFLLGQSGYLAHQRLEYIVKYMGYPKYSFDNGVAGWTMQGIEESGRSLRDEMGITADSEGGSVFADRQGNITYKNRNWLTTDDNLQSVTANLWAKPESDQPYFDGTPTQPNAPTLCLNALQTDWGMSRVVNYVELANAGGTVYKYNNALSQKKYGPRTYSRHDFVLELIGEGKLATRANDIMNGYDKPKLRLNTVTFRPGADGNEWTYALRVFLNWLVRVWYQNARTGWGWLIVTHVQSIEHRVTATDWECTMSVDQPTHYEDAPMQNVFAWDDPRAKWDANGVWV